MAMDDDFGGDVDVCVMVELMCGCPAPCDVCPFGLQEPEKVVEEDGETFTCEQGLQHLATMVQMGMDDMDCGQAAAEAAEAGCLCKEEAGAAGPEATSPAEPAATSAPEAVVPDAAAPATTQAPEADVPELSSPAETAATSAAVVPAATSPAETAATTETPADAPGAPGPDEDPDDSGAGPLGLFVVTLMVAVGTIALA
jgi:hypothetical protein